MNIAPNTFAGWPKLKVVTLKDVTNTSTIGEGAFKNCPALKGADIRGVTSISKEAFYGCSELRFLRVETIFDAGENAFTGTAIWMVLYTNTNVGDSHKFEEDIKSALSAMSSVGTLLFIGDTEAANDGQWRDSVYGGVDGGVDPTDPENTLARFILNL